MALLSLGGSGAWAETFTVTVHSQTAQANNSYATASGATYTTKAASGLTGLQLTIGSLTFDRDESGDNCYLLLKHTATEQTTSTLTIQAPTGFTIKGYSMEACDWNNTRTYTATAADGTSINVTGTTTQTLTVSGLDATSTTITLVANETTTATTYFSIKNFTVTLEPITIEDGLYQLVLKDKAYKITATATGCTSSSTDASTFNITGTGSRDANGYPTYTIKQGSYYMVYSEAEYSNGNNVKLSLSETASNNTFNIIKSGDYVLIRPSMSADASNLTHTYWTNWNASSDNQNIVFWTILDAQSYWSLVPINLVNDKLYRIQQTWTQGGGTNYYYLYANTSDATNGDRLWKNASASTLKLTNSNYIWQAKSSGNYWQIYNPTASRYIAKAASSNTNGDACTALSATSASDGEIFNVMCAPSTDNNPTDYSLGAYVVLKSTTQASSNIYLDSWSIENDYVGWYNAAHYGYYFKFIPVKTVTFTEAVAVNGSDAVSTIYVATDGSDSFKLPTSYKYTIGGVTYFAAGAAAAIAAPGTDDISVTVTSAAITDLANLSNTKAYVITNARGTWQFANDATAMSAGSTTYNAASATQQIAIIQKDSKYYLYSVNAGAYLTASNTLTTAPTDNEQVDIVATENATYPWLFRFTNLKDESEKYTKNINISSGSVLIDGWGPNGSNSNGTLDEGNRNMIIEAADFDAAAALAMFNEVSVTYHLVWSDGTDLSGTVADVNVTTARNGAAASEFRPATFANDFVTFSYSPETTTDGATINVTASWNGPFQLSPAPSDGNFADGTKWYTVGIHSSYKANNYIWTYNSSGSTVTTTSVATDAYDELSDANLFCFVGNPYEGLTIYNRAAGSSKAVSQANSTAQTTMATTGSAFLPKASRQSGMTIANGYACFVPKDQSYYINCYNNSSYNLYGYNDNDGGSTCWFLPAGQYYLNYIDGLNLDAPVGTVGTSEYFTTIDDPATYKSYLTSARSTIASGLYGSISDYATQKSLLGPVKAASTITITNGAFYRLTPAVASSDRRYNRYFGTEDGNPSTFYNASASASTVVKLEANNDAYNIKVQGKYLAAASSSSTNLTLGESAGSYGISVAASTCIASITSNNLYMHPRNSDPYRVMAYSSGPANDAASGWYIIEAKNVSLSLNDGGDDNYYATLYLPFDVTISGATAYTLTLSGEWLVPTAVTDNKVPAGTPVLLRGTASTATANINTGDAFSAISAGSLTGTYTEITSGRTAGEYILSKSGNKIGFYQRASSKKIGANKAYLQLNTDISSGSDVKGILLDWDAATSVNSLPVSSSKQNAIYNLAGQRVAKPTQGIYIVNGKKVIVK